MMFLLAQVERGSNQATDIGAGLEWLLIPAGVLVFFLLVLLAFYKLYRRTESDMAFVRTGLGGMKVVLDGGCLVVPVVHEIKPISLGTMQLEVMRRGKDALITRDSFRVDVMAEFYIKVNADLDSVQAASRSLGSRAMSSASVKELVESKLVGALRSVAATMDLIELHQNRDDFADKVQENLRHDLTQNGLTLESVSITNLDQTDKGALDPDNVFDAEGLKKITDATEKARAEKNSIQRRREAEIAMQDREAREAILAELELTRKAEADQHKNVETYAKQRSAETDQFAIHQDELVETRRIVKEKMIQEAEYAKERELIERRREVEETEIQKNLAVERAEIEKQTQLIEKQRIREETDIHKELAVEKAEKDKEIGIIEKEQEREAADKIKLATVAERERAAQLVLTVEATERANREKQVALITQQAASEQDQIEKQIAADALAYEVQKRAEAEQEAAELQAQAKERLAAALLKHAEAQAEGNRQLNEARNVLSQQVLVQEAALQLIGRLPQIIQEAMKPAERISDIKVLHVGGMDAGENGGHGSPIGGVVNSFLQAGAALPMLKECLRFAGVDTSGSLREVLQKALHAVPGMESVRDAIPEDLRAGEAEDE